ncbi:MAG: ankyrin repeat domain-containing protein, partial [Verrucomicrobiales bacterium]|nr:ankyrin repeat domain-containing protein [Verrucomicrobiales bacterium]
MPLHLLRATLLVTAIAFSSPGLSADQPASQKALVAALQAGELDTAIGLLRSGPPVNQPVDRNNTTLLHLASRSGLAPVVARILELGASPHARDTGGRSALHYLAEANPASSGALQCLLATGSLLVDDLDSTGRTPLSLAAASGNIPTATILFRAGADPLANSLDATSPLKTATQKRNTALLNLFHGTPPPTDPNPLHKASQGGYPSPGLSTPLFAASGLTLPQQTRELLQKNLVTLGRNFAGSPIVDDHLRARALAVALSLDRRYRPAVVADAQLRRGLKPTTLPSSSSPLHVATGFRNFAQRLSPDTSSSDDRRLASLLVDIASKIDPSISVGHLPAPDWTPAFAVSGTSPPPTSLYTSTPPPSLPDASIRTIALTGKPGTFSPVDLSSTARPRPPHAPQTAARFTTPGTGGLAAAITASKTIHSWPEGYQIVLSIPPTIIAADTRVTGLATALLVSSHCSARPLDPDLAAFAEIAPDGQL